MPQVEDQGLSVIQTYSANSFIVECQIDFGLFHFYYIPYRHTTSCSLTFLYLLQGNCQQTLLV